MGRPEDKAVRGPREELEERAAPERTEREDRRDGSGRPDHRAAPAPRDAHRDED